jgi:hypothetical protein
MKTNLSTLFGLGALAMLAGGCASAAETTDTSPDAVATTESKLAEIPLGADQKLEIYGLPKGLFLYKQSGPYGSEPIELPAGIAERGDPTGLFRALAPNTPVPDALLKGVARARADMTAVDSTAEPDPAALDRATHIAQPEPITDSIGIIRPAQTGGTGSAGCPAQFFDLASLNGVPFCPAADGNTVCWHFISWSYLWNGNGRSGYATVCSDSGTTHLNLHTGDSEVPSASFDTPQGTWTRALVETINDCGWWSCSHWHGYFKWQVPGANGAVYNMGAHIQPD